jgi:hypothetical protein
MSEVWYSIKGETLTDMANAVRGKVGGDAPMTPSEMAATIEALNIPSAAETAEFGKEKIADTAPEGKSWFNGVLLPDIPADLLAQYPYAWIRNNTRTGHYELLLGKGRWYYATDSLYCTDTTGGLQWYRIEKSNAESATAWVFNQAWTSGNAFGCDSTRPVFWSNHDIPNGSATATDIYFEGTEPIKEIISGYGDYVDVAESYAVTGEILNELGHMMQKRNATYDLFTGAEVLDYISTAPIILSVSSVDELPTDAEDGTIAIIEG